MTKPTPEEMIEWLEECAKFFSREACRSDENRGFWAATYNAENALRICDYLHSTMYDEEKWVLVPREPTEEMLKAGFDHQGSADEVDLDFAWHAMLAAAPKPTKGDTP